MTLSLTREEIKADPVFSKVLDAVKQIYEVPQHTFDILMANRDTKDFCEESRHFAILGKGDFFIHYDVSSWFSPYPSFEEVPESEMPRDKRFPAFETRFDSITFYDTEEEFQQARKLGGL